MTAQQYREAIAKLGWSQRRAAKELRVDERTSRVWAKKGAPYLVERVLSDLLEHQGSERGA